MVSRLDNVAPKVIENGVIVPPCLQVNEMTLAEHQDYLSWIAQKPRLTREEALTVGHRPDEIDDYFKDRGRSTLPAVTSEAGSSVASIPTAPAVLPSRSGFLRISPVIVAPPSLQPQQPEQASGMSRVVARTMGYTGDVCLTCGSTRMVKNGTCLLCQECGQTTGCS